MTVNTIKHVIATYNMSFASDQNLDPDRADVYESEGAFTLQNAQNTRAFWLEALELIKHFWENENNASVMGLQEMNKDIGAKDVETAMGKINNKKNKHIKVVTEEVTTKFGKPAVTIIWDSEKLGDIKDGPYIADLIGEYKEVKANPPGGRPIIIIYTTKGYLLINCHGQNIPDASKKTMKDFREQLNVHINKFLKDNISDINPSKVFLMGDLNDRYDAINDGILITLNNGKQFKLSYKGDAPKSCCHNWDSSCSNESKRFTKLEIPNRQTVGTCKVPRDTNDVQYTLAGVSETIVRDENGNQLKDENGEFKKIDSPIKGKRYLMGNEGLPKNYRYTGDKVFGEKPIDNIKIYRPKTFINTNMSDHEMVIGTFESIYDRNDLKTTGFKLHGGYINKNKSKKHIKSNKSRKVKQNNKKHKTHKSNKSRKSRKH